MNIKAIPNVSLYSNWLVIKVNKIYKVIIDKKEAGRYLGRTEFDSVEVDNEVVVHSGKELPIGEFVNVQITKAYDYDLEGKVVDNHFFLPS